MISLPSTLLQAIAQLLGHANSTQILPPCVKPLHEDTKAIINALDAARTLQSVKWPTVQYSTPFSLLCIPIRSMNRLRDNCRVLARFSYREICGVIEKRLASLLGHTSGGATKKYILHG